MLAHTDNESDGFKFDVIKRENVIGRVSNEERRTFPPRFPPLILYLILKEFFRELQNFIIKQ